MAEEAKKRGNEAFLQKNFDEAIRHFSESISLDGSNHILFSNRSAAYAGKGMYTEALQDAEKCISLNPNFAKVLSSIISCVF
jgi:tetratricopeptide (TPR) repeat protein